MELLNQIITFFKQFFDWYFIVNPWEQAVFVRLGRKVKVVDGGFYFKIPFIDRIYIQAIRIRTIDLPIQTISTKDGRAITIKLVVRYCIKDIYKLYNSLSHPDTTIAGIVMAKVSSIVREQNSDQISLCDIERNITEQLEQSDYGLGDMQISITNWADVKTFRLIQDQSWMSEGISMETKK